MTEQSITVQGLTVNAPAPYTEGHTINENEAKALNQVFAENLRNNFAAQIKKAKKEKGIDESPKVPVPDALASELVAKFTDYAQSYAFAAKRQAVHVDPVTREARKIAKSLLDAHLAKNGVDKKNLAEGRYDELVAEVIAKYPDKTTGEAKRRIAAAQEVALDSLDSLLPEAAE